MKDVRFEYTDKPLQSQLTYEDSSGKTDTVYENENVPKIMRDLYYYLMHDILLYERIYFPPTDAGEGEPMFAGGSNTNNVDMMNGFMKFAFMFLFILCIVILVVYIVKRISIRKERKIRKIYSHYPSL